MKVKKFPAHNKGQVLKKNKTKKFFQPSQALLIPNMFMLYIEGPMMD